MRSQGPSAESFRILAGICGLISIFMATGSLLAEITGWYRLASMDPKDILMAPCSAIAFVLVGVALILIVSPRRSRRIMGGWFAAAVCVLAALQLVAYISDINLGPLTELFPSWYTLIGPGSGHGHYTSAVLFICSGSGLLLLVFGKRRWISEGSTGSLGLIICFCCLLYILGHLFGISRLSAGLLTSLPPNSVWAFLAMGGGIIFTALEHNTAEYFAHSQQIAAQLTATGILAQNAPVAKTIPPVLEAIGNCLGWDYCAFWQPEAETGFIRCLNVWRSENLSTHLENAGLNATLPTNDNMIGMTLREGKSIWASDIARESGFSRTETAIMDRLETAFTFPVASGGVTLGVVEVLSCRYVDKNADLVAMMTTLGRLLGEFIERRRAEEYSEQFFNLSVDILCIIGFDGRFKSVNSSWLRSAGYNVEEVLDHEAVEFMHRDDRLSLLKQRDTLIAQGASFETRFVCKDGSQRWLLWTLTPNVDQQIFYAAGHDITLRKEHEASLAREHNLLRNLMENFPDNIYIKDRNGRIISDNQTHQQWLGVANADEVAGHTVFDFFPRDMAKFFNADDMRVMETGQALISQEEPVINPKGETRWFLTTKIPLQDDSGQTIGLLGIGRDITSQKQVQEDLRQARDQAEAATLAKSEFLARMSHEIRTPMNAIVGMTELTLETDLSDEQQEYLNIVKTSAESLLSLLNSILDFSKIEAGKLDIEHTPFVLRDNLADAVHTLAISAHQKGLELAVRIAPEVPEEVIGDPTRLRQVLLNLVGNAIKFTPKGEVVLQVSVSSLPEIDPKPISGGLMIPTTSTASAKPSPHEICLHFVVSDTGIGISPNNHQNIFEPFTQADHSTTRRYGGTGLGLAISRQMVQLMGGQIWVEGDKDKGSQFHFTVNMSASPSAVSSTVISQPVSLRGLSVLVVDDNATTRQILGEMLSLWGMTPTAVADSVSALNAVQAAIDNRNPYSVIILDANMPLVEDVELAACICKLTDDKSSVLILTSSDRRRHPEIYDRLGVSAQVLKPIKQSELLNVILRAINTDPSPDANPVIINNAAPSGRVLPNSLSFLLVEDDAINQRLAAILLQKRGWEVTSATSAEEALDIMRQKHFDIVLMDVQLPGMDGLEATRRIRTWEKETGEHQPVIAMTARVMKEDVQACLQAGMDAYISKPVQSTAIEEAVQSVLGLMNVSVNTGVISTNTDRRRPMNGNKLQEGAIFDSNQYMSRVENDIDLARELIRMFLSTSPLQIATLKKLAANGEMSELERAAHAFKSAVGNFGSTIAFNAAFRLEMIGRSGSVSHAEEAVNRLETDVNHLTAALTDFDTKLEGRSTT